MKSNSRIRLNIFVGREAAGLYGPLLVMRGMVAGMGGAFHVGNPAAAARRSKPGIAPAPGENVGISARAPTSAVGGVVRLQRVSLQVDFF